MLCLVYLFTLNPVTFRKGILQVLNYIRCTTTYYTVECTFFVNVVGSRVQVGKVYPRATW
jgi:hypothetical protein